MNQTEYLKSVLPPAPYFFEQNGIAEIASRPRPLTLSLLRKIYGSGGPVQKAYAKYGINYLPLDTLRIFGNQLFVDREQELKSLLPGYSYYSAQPWEPRLAPFAGFLTTLRNAFALRKINAELDQKLLEGLENELKYIGSQEADLETSLKKFLEVYILIFEINIKAEKALSILIKALAGFDIKPSDILASPGSFDFYKLKPIEFDSSDWRGNSLEFGDDSRFVCQGLGRKNETVDFWWQKLEPGQRSQLSKPILDALRYNDLREMGRWLVVGQINKLRRAAFIRAESIGQEFKDVALFANLDELLSGKIDFAELEKRKLEYSQYASWDLPPVLRSDQSSTIKQLKGVGLAPGKATGTLVTAEGIAETEVDVILFTKLLTPDLAAHLGKLKGIVSERGSVLSHLAILARERGIPVVANVDLGQLGVKFGDQITIDGGAGSVNLL